MSDALRAFVGSMTTWLEQAGVPYMLAGSFASTLHGRPRSTQDVDIVIDPTEQWVDTLRVRAEWSRVLGMLGAPDV